MPLRERLSERADRRVAGVQLTLPEKCRIAAVDPIPTFQAVKLPELAGGLPHGHAHSHRSTHASEGHCHGNRVGRAAYRIGCRDRSALLPPSSLPARVRSVTVVMKTKPQHCGLLLR